MLNSRAKLNQLIIGPWVAQMLAVVTKLGIPDLLKEEAKTASQLASATNTSQDALYRTLRALSTVDIVTLDKDGKFSLTDSGHLLRTDVEGSLASMAIMNCDNSHWLPWSKADQAVKTGKPVARDVFGSSFWDYLNSNEEEHQNFNLAMTQTTSGITKFILDSFDFSDYSTVVDVGGGQGALIQSVIRAYPDLKGILFDLPSVIDEAQIPAELSDRLTCEKGSFLDTAPGGGDIYILKHIIHDWSDQYCQMILKNIRNQMNSNGRVLILDMMIEDNLAQFTSWLDLNMMIILGGKERTEKEFSDLYTSAGFELEKVISTSSLLKIVVGKPV